MLFRLRIMFLEYLELRLNAALDYKSYNIRAIKARRKRVLKCFSSVCFYTNVIAF